MSERAWFEEHLRGRTLVQVGDPGPGRVWRPRRLLRWLRRRGVALAAATGVLGAGAGVALAASAPEVGVTVDRGGYHLGSLVLRPRGPGVFIGDGALVISRGAGGTMAASSAAVHGENMLGLCVMAPDATSERCLFGLGSRASTAVDQYWGGAWHRHYDDGQALDIPASLGIPVPFPIGR
jgi:hypothetical protein